MKVTFTKDLIETLTDAFKLHSKIHQNPEKSEVITFEVEGLSCIIRLQVRDASRHRDGSEVHPLMRTPEQLPSFTEIYMIGNMTLGQRTMVNHPGIKSQLMMCSTKVFVAELLRTLGEEIQVITNQRASEQIRNGLHAHAIRHNVSIHPNTSPVSDVTGSAVIPFPNAMRVVISPHGMAVKKEEVQIAKFETTLEGISTYPVLLALIADIVTQSCGPYVRPAREVDLDVDTYIVRGTLYRDLKDGPFAIEPYFSDDRGSDLNTIQTLYDKPVMLSLDSNLSMPAMHPTNYNFNPYGAVPNFNPYTGKEGF